LPSANDFGFANDAAYANDVCFAHFYANITSFLSVAKIHHFGFADTSLVSETNYIIFFNDVCLRQMMLASPMMLLHNDVCFAHFKANIIS